MIYRSYFNIDISELYEIVMGILKIFDKIQANNETANIFLTYLVYIYCELKLIT